MARGDPDAPGNLQDTNAYIQRNCPLLGQRVALCGLTTEALNGVRGTAVDFGCSERAPDGVNFMAASGRYTVRLDGPEGRLVKVRVANVEEVEDDWTGGVGGDGGGGGGSSMGGGKKKKKGAGKKGRRK